MVDRVARDAVDALVVVAETTREGLLVGSEEVILAVVVTIPIEVATHEEILPPL